MGGEETLIICFCTDISLIILPIGYYQRNSLERGEEDFNRINKQEYFGIVKKKKEDGDYLRAHRWVLLEDFRSVTVSNEIYDKVTKGDSVYKEKGCDSVYFFLKNGEVMLRDDNWYRRSHYLKLLNENKEGNN